ncbi:hypothetical protein SAMN04488059_10997 [Devosia psychrophila]|uniref:Lipoprotein n=3 Tax=Devosia psychrophila TaxID=728005 RepID=A0A1I1LDC7_9HYPH|nr:hypothetical protein SAMN04488059_10997 [Devosia psychrophila]
MLRLRRLLMLFPLVGICGCNQKLDDGNPRASFVTVMLDEMQRKHIVDSVELDESDVKDEWPISIDTLLDELRQDGFAPNENSPVSMEKYLAKDCASVSTQSDRDIFWSMNNRFDTSRLTYSVGIRVDASCEFEGLWIAIHPEDPI